MLSIEVMDILGNHAFPAAAWDVFACAWSDDYGNKITVHFDREQGVTEKNFEATNLSFSEQVGTTDSATTKGTWD
jgi:hypothetical protein